MRLPQSRAQRGSQKHLQDLINGKAEDLLSALVAVHLDSLKGSDIEWLSPLSKDDYAEYRDGDFLTLLGLGQHVGKLGHFWPTRGPVWDCLGRTRDHSRFFLVEAKANVPEITSDCKATSATSLGKIGLAFADTQAWLGAKSQIEWTKGFYQTANRLAHLYFLRTTVGVDAYVVNIYFVHDTTRIPTERETWKAALDMQKSLMGLSRASLTGKVIDVYVHTNDILA